MKIKKMSLMLFVVTLSIGGVVRADTTPTVSKVDSNTIKVTTTNSQEQTYTLKNLLARQAALQKQLEDVTALIAQAKVAGVTGQ